MKTFFLKAYKPLVVVLFVLLCWLGPLRFLVTPMESAIIQKLKKARLFPFSQLYFGSRTQKVIGPAGGTIELPKVGRMELPAGALEKPTVVEMIEVLNVEPDNVTCRTLHKPEFEGRYCEPNNDFITPVVRLEPFGLRLKKAARLILPTDAARVGTNSPTVITHVASESAEHNTWTFGPYLEPLGITAEQSKIDEEIRVRQFAYIAKQMPSKFTPTMHGIRQLIKVDVSEAEKAGKGK